MAAVALLRHPGAAIRPRMSGMSARCPAADEPGLVICGTANINAAREVPPGRGGFCVTFDPEHVTLHREQGLVATEPAQALTADYEALLGERRCTLFDVSAISGAAISPLMGAATRHAYRILLTATNVRLGVWLPHPALVREARLWAHVLTLRLRGGLAGALWYRAMQPTLGLHELPGPPG